jgi:putative cardiolipin synthase
MRNSRKAHAGSQCSLTGRLLAAVGATLALFAGPAAAEAFDAPETLSAFRSLSSNEEAYCSRIALIREARTRIDIQTYILTPDITGSGLIRELESAAGRGVAVRLLLDDYGSHEAKARLDRLRRMPGVEIRYINASRNQGLLRRVDYVLRFGQLNRRMHNKSFIVDDRTAIVGGRNIGDVYFRRGGVVFSDLDVIIEGPALTDLRRVFDIYWDSSLTLPLDEIAPLPARPRSVRDPSPELVPSCPTPAEAPPRPLQPVPAVVFSDPPTKLSRAPDAEPAFDPIRDQIRREIETPARSLYIVSPYFIPNVRWVHHLVALRAEGVEIGVLTNSARATNSTPVHAAYSKYRRELLEGGVRLFEFKPTAPPVEEPDLEFAGLRSRSTLHAKTFAVDDQKIFVGSFNFDPRSVSLNTEMGLILRSPQAAGGVRTYFEVGARTSAYELRMQADRIVWVDSSAAGEKVLKREPGVGLFRRVLLKALALAPIEHLL